MQGAKQMRAKRGAMCASRLGQASVYFKNTAPALGLVWNSCACRERARRGEIHDARVKLPPVQSGNPKTPRHSRVSPTPVAEILIPPSIVSNPNKENFCTGPSVKVPRERLIPTQRSDIINRCTMLFKVFSLQE